MKNKILLILGISFALISMLTIELVLMGGVLWFAGIRTSDKPTDLSGLPYLLGALALIALVFFLSRNDGARPEIPTQIINLGYDRKDCDDVIMHMAGKSESRKMGRRTGAPVELVTPSGFDAAKLDYDARLNLDYIKAHPESGITIKKGGK